MTVTRAKLIEVALPLAAINEASRREKSIRHGHPSTLHLWWARRPLAAARAVIFAQMVDDPSADPDRFPTNRAQERERKRLFGILEQLVKWENTANETLLAEAREEILCSWRRACVDNADHPRSAELFDPARLPAFHDPFAGGGALPLEAQRLGLEAHASDLNPVAVLINKAMIEIPPRFAGKPPVNPDSRLGNELVTRQWQGASGLAEDVRYYGQWMRDKAQRRIGHLYPEVAVTPAMAKERSDLKPYEGRKLTVIAWLWARTVRSPNPAFADVEVPLVSTWMLSTKKGKQAYVDPVIEGREYRFSVKSGSPIDLAERRKGTKSGGSGSEFLCMMSGVPMPFAYLREEARAGRMGSRLMAIVAQGDRSRVYLPPTRDLEEIARRAQPHGVPSTRLPDRALGFRVQQYGMVRWRDLFTPRQLVALTTFSDLVGEAMERVLRDAVAAGLDDDDQPLRDGGTGARAYAQAVAVYLGLAVSRLANRQATLCFWDRMREGVQQVFARQALPMVWDYCEGNPFSNSSGNWVVQLKFPAKMIEATPATIQGHASQADARDSALARSRVVSTDPPYYDNIGYADLSDFFYVWLRRSLKPLFHDLFATMAVPKAEELVATPYRHGTREAAEGFFLEGVTKAIRHLAEHAHPCFPATIYYAFKQSESKGRAGVSSTGWEKFLDGTISAGFAITGTWPIRTENVAALKKNVAALASSIILVCRRRPADAPLATRREFLTALRSELPQALHLLQSGNIAPVDLAQAAIGPGMAVYTRYGKVLDANGEPMRVRDALALINQVLDETLAEQEGDFDADTRWALAWFDEHGFREGEFGVAEILSKAKVTAVDGLVEAGIIESRAGKVRLLKPSELPSDWDPSSDSRLTVWEMVHHMIRILEKDGEEATAVLARRLGSVADVARDLAYRLYSISERKKRASEALQYNGLVGSWSEVKRLATVDSPDVQTEFFD